MKQTRDVTVVAYVNHGKATLVDQLLCQSGTFRSNQQVEERVMDSNDLEEERGITIFAKNTAIEYEGYHINIVDTPRYASFGNEVGCVLGMVSCVVLSVDTQGGPMSQTHFVTKEALALGLKPTVVVSKVDKPSACPSQVIDQAFEPFDSPGAADEQLDFLIVYASGLSGSAKLEEVDESNDIRPLLEIILEHTPAPSGGANETLQLQISQLDCDNYTGRLGTGRILDGRIKPGQVVAVMNHEEQITQGRIDQLLGFQGLERIPLEEAETGDIIIISGTEDTDIGVTITDKDNLKGLSMLNVDESTPTIDFMVNTPPLAGTEGKFVASRQIRDRLQKGLLANIVLRIEDIADTGVFYASGRGELHLTILLESMRHEGFELAVGKPHVIFREINNQKREPCENLAVDVPDGNQDAVMEKLGRRRNELTNTGGGGNDRTRLEYHTSARSLIGFQGEFITLIRGTGLTSHVFDDHAPVKPDMPGRHNDVLVSQEQGEAAARALWDLEGRNRMFASPNDKVHGGMIIGIHNRDNDLMINPLKGRKLINICTSGTDEVVHLTTPIKLTLEGVVELVDSDELVEITPQSIHLRKRYLSEPGCRHHFKKLD